MKSLHKTFDILEYVVLQNGECVTPSRAAEALDVNPATCTRIMGELVKRGYLTQVSRKNGYTAGPMTVSLGTRRNGFERLAEAGRGPVRELSERLGRQVNLAVLDHDRRIMLCYHLSDREMKPWDRFFFASDHWDTATGRLLIAALDDREARKLTAALGIRPFPARTLAEIRRKGSVRFEQNELVVIGHLLRLPGFPAAAFGFGIEPENADRAFAASTETAEKIRTALVRPNQAY